MILSMQLCTSKSLGLLLLMLVAACAPAIRSLPTDSSAPKWTFENPNADKAHAAGLDGLGYNAEAATDARRRMRDFLTRHLN